MKPEPPNGRDPVGEACAGDRDDLEPRSGDQVAALGDRDDGSGG